MSTATPQDFVPSVVPTPAQAAPAAFVAAPAPVPAPVPDVSPLQAKADAADAVRAAKAGDSKDMWTPTAIVTGVLGLVSIGVSAYHGYKRNGDDTGWGLAWGFFGGIFPIATPLVALAQGFAKPSDDVRLHRLEGALGGRPDLVRELNAQMMKGPYRMPSAERLSTQDLESFEHKHAYRG